jgi:hypothetical protein
MSISSLYYPEKRSASDDGFDRFLVLGEEQLHDITFFLPLELPILKMAFTKFTSTGARSRIIHLSPMIDSLKE